MADALKPGELAIQANSFQESISYATLPLLQIPTIDVCLLSSSLSSQVEVELRKLRSALSSSGYFQAVNHGMSALVLDEVLEVTRRFFDLPLEEKNKYSKTTAYDFDGYVCNTRKENQTHGWNERLYLHVLPESLRKFEKWPRSPENLRGALLEFTEKLSVMNEIILKAMAKSLNLEENCFLNQFGENPTVLSSFNYYPPCPWPDLFVAAKPHADASGTTYILQDNELEGLQVLKNDQWHRVPLTPDAIVFSIGDQVEIMSNGIFKSPVHRVVTNNKGERISVALFFAPEPTCEIKPEEGLIDYNNPRLYKNVVDYSRHYFYEHVQHGRTPIDALKI